MGKVSDKVSDAVTRTPNPVDPATKKRVENVTVAQDTLKGQKGKVAETSETSYGFVDQVNAAGDLGDVPGPGIGRDITQAGIKLEGTAANKKVREHSIAYFASPEPPS